LTRQHIDVFDYAGAVDALTNSALNRSAAVPDPTSPLTTHVLNLEGEPHRAVRAAVSSALDVCTSAVLPLVRPTAAALLNRIDGEVDLAASFVRPLTLTIVDALVGLADDDVQLKWWHDAAIALETGLHPHGPGVLRDRIAQLVADRRKMPRPDVISQLARVPGLTVDQLHATIFFAFSAGYVNTANFLGRSLLALAAHPDQFTWLREHPGAVSGAVEELLRFSEPPGRASMRVAARDTTVAGQAVVAGTVVHVFRSRANRDAGRFSQPDDLDLHRLGRSSLAFGAGPHYCAGAGLVRSVADLTLLTLADHVRAIDIVPRTNLAWDFPDELWLGVATTHDRLAAPASNEERS
jgi:cytochrome P450